MRGTLIFDWDGTLHDTKRLYGAAFRAAYSWLVEGGYAPAREYGDDEVSVYLGMSAPVMWETFMPQLPQAVKEEASGRIGSHMVSAIRRGEAKLYPGAEEALDRLKAAGHRLVFLSNCKRPYLDAHRAQFGLDRWFDGFYCCQEFDFLPKKDIFPVIAKNYPGPYCMIGDRQSDIDVAVVNGLVSVGCAYGFGLPGELDQATAIARDVSQLPEIVAAL